MVSYIGLGISIAIIILLAIIVYFCCCRKDKRNVPPVDGQVQHEVPPSANLIPPSDGPGYPLGPPALASRAPAGVPIGWNLDQAPVGVSAPPYPIEASHQQAGSGWGGAPQPNAPPPPPSTPPPAYAPPPYPTQ